MNPFREQDTREGRVRTPNRDSDREDFATRVVGKDFEKLIRKMKERGYNIVFTPIESGSGKATFRFIPIAETIPAPGYILTRGCKISAYRKIEPHGR